MWEFGSITNVICLFTVATGSCNNFPNEFNPWVTIGIFHSLQNEEMLLNRENSQNDTLCKHKKSAILINFNGGGLKCLDFY